ncbi:MAG: hypothetical protein AABW92_00395 [Nanoarchaeota archaeon]
MALQIPESMEELVYWTSRKINDGFVKAWVEKENCPMCKKGLMGKPVVKGKVKIRATQYICPKCNYTVEKGEYEDTLTTSILYTCPHCKHKGETQVPYKRKKFKGADSIIFVCENCKENVPITKKLKRI